MTGERDLLRLYVADKEDGSQQFTNDQLDVFLTDAANDVHLAANRVWLVKAATVADWFMTQTDGSLFARQQVFDHCKAMADYHLDRSGGEMVNVSLDSGSSSPQSVEF